MDTLFGHACGVRVQGRAFGARVDGPLARGLWPPDGGGLCRRVVKGKVLKMDRPDGRKVLKFDGPSGRGLWYRPAGDEYKVSVTDLPFCVIGLISILVISRCAAPPYPAAPDFLHGKACHTILRSLRFLTNRVPLPPHPGDRINRSMLSCRDMAPWLSTHSPTTKWREGGGASHQRGIAFPRPQGGCKGFL